ncbi:DUF1127 domain-containing protein [Mesorhizobium sp. CAU 1732]|uniref:DUF1127 domain-containing protein n=1 Tax=Mesorhizobium sp. CAU 1732 TaxID=3140358 RepID=UPI003260486F
MHQRLQRDKISLLSRLRRAWRQWRATRQQRHALDSLIAKPDDRLLEDAGMTRDEAERLRREARLMHIALWASVRGRGD